MFHFVCWQQFSTATVNSKKVVDVTAELSVSCKNWFFWIIVFKSAWVKKTDRYYTSLWSGFIIKKDARQVTPNQYQNTALTSSLEVKATNVCCCRSNILSLLWYLAPRTSALQVGSTCQPLPYLMDHTTTTKIQRTFIFQAWQTPGRPCMVFHAFDKFLLRYIPKE